MDYNEFAGKIKTKYPDYADMDNRELAQKMVAKFPEYSDVTFDEPVPEQGVLGAVGVALSSRPELQPYGAPSQVPNQPETAVGGAINAATQTLSAPIRLGQTLAQGPDVVGEGVSNLGNEVGYPKTGAAVGTAIQMAPYLAGAAQGVRGLYSGSNKYAQAIRKTPQVIGAEMGAGEQAAGVTSRLPELRGAQTRFPKPEMNVATKSPKPLVDPETIPSVPPKSYPSDMNTFINSASDRIEKFGDKLSPQELTDYQRQIGSWMNTGKISPRDPIGAIATKVSKKAVELRNAKVPGRAELNKVYGLSKKLHPDVSGALKDYVAKYGKRALAEAVAIGTGGAIAASFWKK